MMLYLFLGLRDTMNSQDASPTSWARGSGMVKSGWIVASPKTWAGAFPEGAQLLPAQLD